MNSRERLFVGVLALAGGVLGGIISNSFTGRRAPATPATVTAKNFVLVDQTGKRRAQLSVSEHQTANLDLYDANGASRAQLGVLPDGTTVFTFSDESGKPSLLLSTTAKSGSGTLAFFNPDGALRAQLGMEKGDPKLALNDHLGKQVMRINVDGDQPALALYDQQGIWRTLMTLNQDGTPELGLADQSNRPRLMLGLQPDGRSTFVMTSDDGKPLAVFGQMPDGAPSLRLMGDDGAVLGKVP